MEKCFWVPVAGLFGLIPVMVEAGLLALGKHIILILDNNKLLYSILPVFLVSSPALLLKDILPLWPSNWEAEEVQTDLLGIFDDFWYGCTGTNLVPS